MTKAVFGDIIDMYKQQEVFEMALPINMDDLINQRVVESTRIEFKGDWNPNPIIHSICAFANDIDNVGGGYLVIGIEEENGSPVLPPKGMLMCRKETQKNLIDSPTISVKKCLQMERTELYLSS